MPTIRPAEKIGNWLRHEWQAYPDSRPTITAADWAEIEKSRLDREKLRELIEITVSEALVMRQPGIQLSASGATAIFPGQTDSDGNLWPDPQLRDDPFAAALQLQNAGIALVEKNSRTGEALRRELFGMRRRQAARGKPLTPCQCQQIKNLVGSVDPKPFDDEIHFGALGLYDDWQRP